MKVIKNINNNVSVCIDGKGNELIAFGKGIGFKQPPYDIDNLDAIHRTFYDVNPKFLDLINQIDEDVFEISVTVINYASKLNTIFDPNVVFTLADHIQFAIKRFQDNMAMKFSLYYDLDYMNPEEVEVGRFAYEQIRKKMNIVLPKEEIYGIALHLMNAQAIGETRSKEYSKISSNKSSIDDITKIIEKYFKITIDKKGFNYSRFVSHMEYLFKRCSDGITVSSSNIKMFDTLKKQYPDVYNCSMLICDYFENKLKIGLNEEELLYLMLHINRICSREDCYQ